MLKENLFLKQELRFHDGKFRIILFSDTQDGTHYDPRTPAAINAMVEREKPDLVLFDGDNVNRCGTPEEFCATLSAFVEPLEKRGIPWAHVFGNHDEERNPLTKQEQQAIYEKFPHCISKSAAGIHGVGNHVLPVKASRGDRIAFAVWGLDSNQYIRELGDEIGYPGLEQDIRLPEPLVRNCEYDIIRFDQIMWYYNSSLELERHNGGRIPAIMYFHTCLEEFMAITKNPVFTCMTGEHNEPICPGPVNSGMFAALLQRGDVKGVFCGHDHINTYEGTYCGIRLSFVDCIGFGTYGLGGSDAENNRLRGARMLDIDEANPDAFTSTLLLASDYLK
ncbi:MAG: metallophosphoesterase family protein [Oscillospiraceae bacterium]|nr:metallophosphoesterase family protein [Oscillospiraceae bacterium]